MKRLATQFALLALVGTLGAVAPAWAAPGDSGGQGGHNRVNCQDPASAQNPFCMNRGKGGSMHNNGGSQNDNGNTHHRGGNDNNNTTTNNNNTNPPMNNTGSDHNGRDYNGSDHNGSDHGPMPGMGGPGHNDYGMDRGHDNHGGYGDFRDFRRHFNFRHFSRPNFDIRPGFLVPRFFDLSPLPPEFFFYYPQYRGYLYFETPDGRLVIVSRRTHRIVAIL